MSDERKYRQRGYQDSGRGSERGGSRGAGRDQPPPEKKDGPRGRGLGAPTASVFRCAACGEKRSSGSGITLETLCGRCGAPLHSCSNCIHFDTASRWECRRHAELQARVAKKTAANACTLFTPKVTQEFGQESEKPLDPRAAFDALFKR
jgi:hypothetical protein